MDVSWLTRPLEHPDAAALTAEMRAEVNALYQRPDAGKPLLPEEFEPPRGRFVVGYDGDHPVACGGYRRIDGRLARVQRVFVRPAARGRALSRLLMQHLEDAARADGFTSLDLHTGVRQPAAVRVYEGLGYTPIPVFAPYTGDPLSLCYAKDLA
ncbi:GNAT family N-acetyltransferase [Acidothermaceae bacterium B102]|nr:GNAT family N-acetyltransferase [Acidothermaceae bacterium B102]